MNERIRELAKQALPNVKFWDEEFIRGTPGITEPNTRATNLNELEKFAELIVKECISELEKIKRSGVPTPIQGGLNLGVVSLKEHFGVEE